MIDFYEKEDFSRTVYTVDIETLEIDSHVLRDLCEEFCEKTTTPYGIASKFFVDGKTLRQYQGSNSKVVREFDTAGEAEHALYLIFKYDLENDDDAPSIFYTLKEAREFVEQIETDD